jgi:hypothetical protein
VADLRSPDARNVNSCPELINQRLKFIAQFSDEVTNCGYLHAGTGQKIGLSEGTGFREAGRMLADSPRTAHGAAASGAVAC